MKKNTKKVKVIFSSEAEKIYDDLIRKSKNSKSEKMIVEAIHKKIEFLKLDVHYGNPISKKLIPYKYKIKYDVSNLFRVELPRFWRMIYTLTNEDERVEIIAFVLDILDHKKYNHEFGYKNK